MERKQPQMQAGRPTASRMTVKPNEHETTTAPDGPLGLEDEAGRQLRAGGRTSWAEVRTAFRVGLVRQIKA